MIRFKQWTKFSMVALISAASLFSCGKKSTKGASLGLPKVEPPVTRNTPQGIKSSSSLLLADSSLSTMGSRLFTVGPTSILERLKTIDSRLSEMDTRSQESERKCTSEAAKEWTLPGKLPGNASFPIYLQCLDSMDSNNSKFQVAFGVKDDYVYLVELQAPGTSATSPGIATLVKAKKDGTSTEAWITMQKFDQSISVSADDYFFLGIKADDSKKSFEVSVAGTGKGIGVDCGVRVQSDGSYVYGAGVFASKGGQGSEDCSGDGASGHASKAAICANASDISTADAANCTNLTTFTLPEMTNANLAAAGSKAESDKFLAATISGITAFSDEKESK